MEKELIIEIHYTDGTSHKFESDTFDINKDAIWFRINEIRNYDYVASVNKIIPFNNVKYISINDK